MSADWCWLRVRVHMLVLLAFFFFSGDDAIVLFDFSFSSLLDFKKFHRADSFSPCPKIDDE